MNTKTDQPEHDQPDQSAPAGKRRGKYLATRHRHLVRYPTTKVLYLYFKHKGKRHERSLETTVESVALVKAAEEIKTIKASLQEGEAVKNGKISLAELLDHFLEAQKRRVEAHELKQRSYEAIEDGVEKIRREQAALLPREAARISFKEIDDYVHGVRKRQSPTSVNKVVDAFKSAYALAIDEHLIARNPAQKLKRASIHGVKSDLIPTDEEYARLIADIRESKLSHKWHVIDLIEFLAAFGLRINEARQVLKTDVNLGDRVLTVRKETTKNGKARAIPIFENTVPLIERLLGRKNLRIYGKEVRTDKLLAIGKCYGALRSSVTKLSLPIKGHHTFRHLCATRWLEQGVNIKQVAKWLGHSDGGGLALRIYTTARDAQDKLEAAKVGRQSETGDTVFLGGVAYSKAQLETALKQLTPAKSGTATPGTLVAEDQRSISPPSLVEHSSTVE